VKLDYSFNSFDICSALQRNKNILFTVSAYLVNQFPKKQSVTQFTYDWRKELLSWWNHPQMLKLNDVSNYSSPSLILPKLEPIISIKLPFQGVFLQFYCMSNILATTMQHDLASTQIWLIPEDLKHGTLPHSKDNIGTKDCMQQLN
jgi:hypothetical protein